MNLLLSLTAGLVGCFYINRLDKLSESVRGTTQPTFDFADEKDMPKSSMSFLNKYAYRRYAKWWFRFIGLLNNRIAQHLIMQPRANVDIRGQ